MNKYRTLKIINANSKGRNSCKFNFDLNCSQFRDFVRKNNQILKTAKPSTKYT